MVMANDESVFEKKLKDFWHEFSMDCLDGETIHRYLDGELDPDEKTQVEEHLEVCAICSWKKKEVFEVQKIADKFPEEDAEEPRVPAFAEKLYRLASLSVEKLMPLFSKQISLPNPIKLLALTPLSEQAAFADSGGKFEKQIQAEEEIPFDIEIVVFGKKLVITAKSKSRLYDRCVVVFRLLEGKEIRFSGIIMILDGEGKYETSIDAVQRPQKENLTIKIQPLHSLDLLSKIEDEASVEVFSGLLRDRDSQIRLACVELLGDVGTGRAKEMLKMAFDDPDPDIRNKALELIKGK
jgi:hypothetical protein